MRAWLVSQKNTHMLSSKLAQAGAWGRGQQPPHLQTYCSQGELVGFNKTHICTASFKKVPEAVKQACTRVKTAGGGGGGGGGGRWGGAEPPPFANTMLAWLVWLVSKTLNMLSSKLAQEGGWGAQQPPRLQTHRSHGEWRGFKKTQISLRQHYLTTTVLTAVIDIFIFMYIFIAIISMCMYACMNGMNACLYMQWM